MSDLNEQAAVKGSNLKHNHLFTCSQPHTRILGVLYTSTFKGVHEYCLQYYARVELLILTNGVARLLGLSREVGR